MSHPGIHRRMGLVAYLGFVALSVGIAVAVARFRPSVLARLGRQADVGARGGWAAFGATVLWVFAPVLFGAETGDGEAWVVGAAVAGVGAYFVVVAVGSVGEYRLLAGVEHRDPRSVTPGSPVAVSGVPTVEGPEDAAVTPFTGHAAVQTDWLVQTRRRLGLRRTWTAVDGGVETVPFTLGGAAVRVPAGPDRVISNAEAVSSADPDEALPEPAASVCREHPSLPDPAARENQLRFLQTYVPADEPVTVVGTARQADEPGALVIEDAPTGALPGPGDGEEVVLLNGDADAAESTLRKRVYGLGVVGVAMLLAGQALSFLLSAATLSRLA